MGAWGSSLVPQPGSSPDPILSALCGGSRHGYEWLNHKPLAIDSASTPSSFPRNQGVGLEVPTLYSGFVPLATSPFLRCFPEATSLTKENTNSKGFRSSVAETVLKTKCTFLINHDLAACCPRTPLSLGHLPNILLTLYLHASEPAGFYCSLHTPQNPPLPGLCHLLYALLNFHSVPGTVLGAGDIT